MFKGPVTTWMWNMYLVWNHKVMTCSTVLIIDPCPLMLQFLEDWSSARQPLSFHTVFSI